MKTAFSSAGLITITAETKEENETLFKMVNEQNFTPTGKVKRTYTKKTDHTNHHRKPRAIVECPVIGCDKLTKNTANHILMAHGITKDGEAHDETNMHGTFAKVTKPVVKLPNGEYKLQNMGGLLS